MISGERKEPLILIIEDEDLLSRMYSKKLTGDGYKCIVAPDGEAGFKMALEKKPDLIMLDMMMPKKDGLTTLKEIKQEKEISNIPVIMLSNVSEEQYVEEALERGAVSYLVKSDTLPAEVVKKVKKTLEVSGKKSLITDK